MFNIKTNILNANSVFRDNNQNFFKRLKKCTNFKCINNAVKRDVKLISNYIILFTKNEKEKQFLI